MNYLTETYRLANGVKMPKVGFGTWQIKPGDDAYQAVSQALSVGYRHIDTAQGYGNEESVGKAIHDSGIPREDIFLTTKLESHIKDYDGALAACEESLKKLSVDYVDLIIIHAPWPWSEMGKDCKEGNIEAFRALETLYERKQARAIGVSNFSVEDLENIVAHNDVVPHVNQIGYFIGIDQSKTINYCNEHNIFVQAYSPLGIGYLLDNEVVNEAAKALGKTPAQICLRYLLQKGVAPLPKSVNKHRMVENARLDFEIDVDWMTKLDAVQGDPRRWE